MAHIIVNLALVREVESALKNVHSQFTNAEKLTEEWGSIVGHSGLADELDEFSGNWDDTRDNMLEAIEGMATLAGAIAQAFEDGDSKAADGLQEGN